MATAELPSSHYYDDAIPIVVVPDDAGAPAELPSSSFASPDGERDMRKKAVPSNAPAHPIPSMQNAFAESLIEVTSGAIAKKPPFKTGDAKTRRQALLDQHEAAGPPLPDWRYRPGQRYHELSKLMAQVSFGVYLLLNGLANSNQQVVSILQGHIDEVDQFLEVTMEDFNFAMDDLTSRIDYLKLPMENMIVFRQMLEDRTFRRRIVDGNEKIEHILSRTSTALEQSVHDLAEGLKATREFMVYLAGQQEGRWRRERPAVSEIYDAMKGNIEGWFNAFVELQNKSDNLGAMVIRLGSIVAEIDKTAGEVSRHTRFSIQPAAELSDTPQSPNQSSQASFQTTPQTSPNSTAIISPVTRIPQSPPRLANPVRDRSSRQPFFDIPSRETRDSRDSFSVVQHKLSRLSEFPIKIDIPMSPPRLHDPATAPEVVQEQSRLSKVPIKVDIPALLPRRYDPTSAPEVVRESTRFSALPIHIDIPASPPMRNDTASAPEVVPEVDAALEEEPLYILQPRTYTPQPPEPMPSPMVRNPPSPKAEPEQPRHKTSLRQRVSLKKTLPESIHVPPPNVVEPKRSAYASPRTYHAPDSAYGSDIDRQHVHSMVVPNHNRDFSPPVIPGHIPSPRSDQQQYFHPRDESMHSPVSLHPPRPHTSGTNYISSHNRGAPSAMGMSMLSHVTTMSQDTNSTAAGGHRLKKKRSAFGWLKKAFTMDEDERAAYEQRRNAQPQSQYYEARSPRFLDGRRIQ